MARFIHAWIQFFVLLTPFFALSMFVLYTADQEAKRKKALATKVTLAVLVLCLLLFFLGNPIFELVGITIDSFRVGAGILLFLSAISLVQGNERPNAAGDDVAVVPLAIPIIVGPATTGAILISGAETVSASQHLTTLAALVAAVASIGAILFSSEYIERAIKPRGIAILSKLTGLVLSAMASQMVFDGAKSLLGSGR
jgi:multiple antibiotic resistance protein